MPALVFWVANQSLDVASSISTAWHLQVVCHWMWPNPVWHVASYLSLDRTVGNWVWDPSFRDRVQAMNCSGYEPCIFIKVRGKCVRV